MGVSTKASFSEMAVDPDQMGPTLTDSSSFPPSIDFMHHSDLLSDAEQNIRLKVREIMVGDDQPSICQVEPHQSSSFLENRFSCTGEAGCTRNYRFLVGMDSLAPEGVPGVPLDHK